MESRKSGVRSERGGRVSEWYDSKMMETIEWHFLTFNFDCSSEMKL